MDIIKNAAYTNLTISGGGTDTFTGATSLTAAGILTLTSGVLELKNNDLTIANTNMGTAFSGVFGETNMIATDGTGYLIFNNTCTIGIQIIPIGSIYKGNNFYSPVAINAEAGGNTNVELRAVSTTFGANFINKYFDVLAGAAGRTFTMTFNYDPNETKGNPASYTVWYKSGAANWQTPPPLPGIPSTSSYAFTITNTTSITNVDTWWSAGSSTNYYSFQSGNWDSTLTWTTDPVAQRLQTALCLS